MTLALRSALLLVVSGVWFLCAAVLIVAALPLLGLVFYWEGLARWLSWLQLALPAWIGLMSIPGCVTAWRLSWARAQERPPWIAASLLGAVGSSASALASGWLLPQITIPAALSLAIGCGVYWAGLGPRAQGQRLLHVVAPLAIGSGFFVVTLSGMRAGG